MLHEYVVDQTTVPWRGLNKEGWPKEKVTYVRRLLDGLDGGPEAINTRHPEGYGSDAHFHLGAQFQVLIHGSLSFPNIRMEAPAVHYTDHNVAYGPFTSNNGEDIFVLHAKRANAVQMKDLKDRESRRLVNRTGREITAVGNDCPWQPMVGHAGAKRKVLISEKEGPAAELMECPPGMDLTLGEAHHGRYDVVLSGSVTLKGKQLGPRSLRFVRGDEAPSPIKCGPQGATIITLTFGKDAEWVAPEDLNVSSVWSKLPMVPGMAP